MASKKSRRKSKKVTPTKPKISEPERESPIEIRNESSVESIEVRDESLTESATSPRNESAESVEQGESNDSVLSPPTSTREALDALLSLVRPSPESLFFDEGAEAEGTLMNLLPYLFQQVERVAAATETDVSKNAGSISGLDKLWVESNIDAETVWGQVDLLNAGVLKKMKKDIKKLVRGVEKGTEEEAICLVDLDGLDGQEEVEDEDEDDSEEEEDDSEEDSEDEDSEDGSEDDEARKIRERMERSMAEMEMDMDSAESEEELPMKGTDKPETEESSVEDPAADDLNDGFFNLHELENFADEEEAFHDPTASEKKYRQDDEIEALDAMYKPLKDSNNKESEAVNMTAADLYGKPDRYHEKENIPTTTDTAITPSEDPKTAAPSKPVSTLQSQKLIDQTKQLEADILAEKPWRMLGETSSKTRPVNSLLQKTPQFEFAGKPAPLITMEHTESMEEIIKRRILNEDWDDVLPRELPSIKTNFGDDKPEVSQEKSKLSLGELYEREYLKKAVGFDKDKAEQNTQEEEAKLEMKALFASLCGKLDALSNYHFTPRPVVDEQEIKSVCTPAIAVEEVIPMYVSDQRALAPEQIYKGLKGDARGGVLKGESELDATEKKALRGAKKASRRKDRQAKRADERLISKLSPGLGLNNPYEKRKLREDLSFARSRGKVVDGVQDENKDYTVSKKFFEKLQKEVEGDVQEGSKRRKVDDGMGDKKKSSAYML